MTFYQTGWKHINSIVLQSHYPFRDKQTSQGEVTLTFNTLLSLLFTICYNSRKEGIISRKARQKQNSRSFWSTRDREFPLVKHYFIPSIFVPLFQLKGWKFMGVPTISLELSACNTGGCTCATVQSPTCTVFPQFHDAICHLKQPFFFLKWPFSYAGQR